MTTTRLCRSGSLSNVVVRPRGRRAVPVRCVARCRALKSDDAVALNKCQQQPAHPKVLTYSCDVRSFVLGFRTNAALGASTVGRHHHPLAARLGGTFRVPTCL